MKSFLQPLCIQEESDIIMKLRTGNREARDTLIERNLRLVAHVVKKYAAVERDNDDLISIGTIGLIKAIDTFDPDKGIKLATYAARCIENELLMMLRSQRKQAREIYLNDSIGCDKEGNEISLLDIIETTDEDVTERMERDENVSRLQILIQSVLTGRERNIICLRYGIRINSDNNKKVESGTVQEAVKKVQKGAEKETDTGKEMIPDGNEYTQREIAKQFGISRSYVSRIEKKALRKLRDAYQRGVKQDITER